MIVLFITKISNMQRCNIPPLEHVRTLFRINCRAYYSRFTDAHVDLILHGSSENQLISSALQVELTEAFRIDHSLYVRTLSITRLHDRYGNRDMIRRLTDKVGSLENVFLEKVSSQSYAGIHQPWIINKILEVIIYPKRKMYIGRIPKGQIEKVIGPIDFYVEIPS